MKRFYKSLTIVLGLVVAIVGAITSFNNYDEVKAGTCSGSNCNYINSSDRTFEYGALDNISYGSFVDTNINLDITILGSKYLYLQDVYLDGTAVNSKFTDKMILPVGSYILGFSYLNDKDLPINGNITLTITAPADTTAPTWSSSTPTSLTYYKSTTPTLSYSMLQSALSSYASDDVAVSSIEETSVANLRVSDINPGTYYSSWFINDTSNNQSISKSITINYYDDVSCVPTYSLSIQETGDVSYLSSIGNGSNTTISYYLENNLIGVYSTSNCEVSSSNISVSQMTLGQILVDNEVVGQNNTFSSYGIGNHILVVDYSYNGKSSSITKTFSVLAPVDTTSPTWSSSTPTSLTYYKSTTPTLSYSMLQSSLSSYASDDVGVSSIQETAVADLRVSDINPGTYYSSWFISDTSNNQSISKSITINYYDDVSCVPTYSLSIQETGDVSYLSNIINGSNTAISYYLENNLIGAYSTSNCEVSSSNISVSQMTLGQILVDNEVVGQNNTFSSYGIGNHILVVNYSYNGKSSSITKEFSVVVLPRAGLPEQIIINASLGNGEPLTFVSFMDYLSSHYETPQGVIISFTPQTNPVYGSNIYEFTFTQSETTYGPYSLELIYRDDIPPVINRVLGNIVSAGTSDTDVLLNIKNSLSVSDNYSSLTINNITIDSDNYTSNKNIPGSYDVVFKVYDDFNNYCSYTITINVVDNTPPVITGTLIYNSSVDSPITINSIISGLTAIDNVNGDVSSSIVVKTDNYSENKDKVGTYYVVFTAEDSLLNKSEISVRIKVVDNSTSTSITGILGLIKKVFDFIVNIFKSIFGL